LAVFIASAIFIRQSPDYSGPCRFWFFGKTCQPTLQPTSWIKSYFSTDGWIFQWTVALILSDQASPIIEG